jgi:hypothetical protein
LCHTDLNDHSVLQVYIIVMGIALCILDFIRWSLRILIRCAT